MANLSLSQLREAQKANPTGSSWFAEEPICHPAKVTGGSPAEGSLPLQASPPAPPVTLAGAPLLERAWAAGGDRGHCRIFPATFSTAADIPEDWKAKFWSALSPWCSVEGQPNHPDFEANLTAIEAQDVKSEKGC